MKEQKELTSEIKKLNNQLEGLRNSGKHMIYSANPFKFSLFNFLAGIFHTLGSLVGYIIIVCLAAYLLSRVNINELISKWMENTLGQIEWEKIIPAPKVPSNLNLNDVKIEGLEGVMGGQLKGK